MGYSGSPYHPLPGDPSSKAKRAKQSSKNWMKFRNEKVAQSTSRFRRTIMIDRLIFIAFIVTVIAFLLILF